MSCPQSINTKNNKLKTTNCTDQSIIRHANHIDDKTRVKSKPSVKIYDYINL